MLPHAMTRSLTIQKKEELAFCLQLQGGLEKKKPTLRSPSRSQVAYGLPVSAAPSLKENDTQHVEADEYHKQPDRTKTRAFSSGMLYDFCTPCDHFHEDDVGAEHRHHRRASRVSSAT